MKLEKVKIKQMSLTVLAIFLICVGYLNSSLEIKKEENLHGKKRVENEINIGDVELVNSEPIENYVSGDVVPNDVFENDKLLVETSSINDEEINNTITNNSEMNFNYFEETRIERQKMYSEMVETYEKIVENPETPSDQKAIAIQEISNITNIKNGIMISENLIKNKGFEEVVILVNNNTASVVVKSYILNQEQISKIQNIIQRELKIETKNINISNIF